MKMSAEAVMTEVSKGGEPTIVAHAPGQEALGSILKNVSNAFRNTAAVVLAGAGLLATGAATLISKISDLTAVASFALGLAATSGGACGALAAYEFVRAADTVARGGLMSSGSPQIGAAALSVFGDAAAVAGDVLSSVTGLSTMSGSIISGGVGGATLATCALVVGVGAVTLAAGYAGVKLTDFALNSLAAEDSIGEKLRGWRKKASVDHMGDAVEPFPKTSPSNFDVSEWKNRHDRAEQVPELTH